jgi:uncharacterized protein YoxC
MKSFSPLIFLTAVVFTLATSSVVWGASEGCTPKDINDKKAKKNTAEANIRIVKTKIDLISDKMKDSPEGKKLQQELEDATKAKENIDSDISTCNDNNSANKEICKEKLTEFNKIKEDFPYASQAAAQSCLGTDEDDSEITSTVVNNMLNQDPNGKPGCDFGGAKTSSKEKRKDITSDINKLDEKVRKYDDEFLKEERRSKEELDRIEEDREKEKEKWEKTQEDASDAQEKALNDLRNNQISIAQRISTLQNEIMKLTQNIGNIEIEIKAALTNAKSPSGKIVNLRSESAIHMNCTMLAKAANKDFFGSSGASNNISSGAQRVKILKDTYDNCVTELHDLRQTIGLSYQQDLTRRVANKDAMAKQLAQAEDDMSHSVEQYNKLLQKVSDKLTKESQKYYEKDNKLANNYNDAMTQSSKKKALISQNKTKDQQKLNGFYTSQGNITDEQMDEIISKSEELDEIYKAATDEKGLNCDNFKGVKDPTVALKGIKDKRDKRANQ